MAAYERGIVHVSGGKRGIAVLKSLATGKKDVWVCHSCGTHGYEGEFEVETHHRCPECNSLDVGRE